MSFHVLSLLHWRFAHKCWVLKQTLVTEQGRQPVEVAKELGICIDTLRSWLKASGIQMGQVSRQNREQKRIRELEAENRSLRRQLGEKDEVIDVLKKSVGILSKP